jgi:hypothetical protein
MHHLEHMLTEHNEMQVKVYIKLAFRVLTLLRNVQEHAVGYVFELVVGVHAFVIM